MHIGLLIGITAALCVSDVAIAREPFTGKWWIDLRNPVERQKKADCGNAVFKLEQLQDKISGTHSMATVGCGRLNEDGPVKGVIVGDTAVLAVTSGRNGAVVLGKAKLVQGKLTWEVVEEIHGGVPEGDSPLILHKGVLSRLQK